MDYWITKIKTNNLEEEDLGADIFNFQPETIFDVTRKIFDKFKLECSIYVLVLLGSKLYKYVSTISLKFERQTVLNAIPSVELGSSSNDPKGGNCLNKQGKVGLELNKNDRECILCLTEIYTGKQLHCGHIFHEMCIEEYLDENNFKCPLCGLHFLVSKMDFAKVFAKNPNHFQVLCKGFQLVDGKSNSVLKEFPFVSNGKFLVF